jgi:putative transposase
MIADAQDAGVSLLDGPGGLIGQLTARVIERALGAEMDDHLGYVKGDPAGNGTGNSRNGSFGKTVTTTSGPVRLSPCLVRPAGSQARDARRPTVKWRVVRAWNEAERDGPP